MIEIPEAINFSKKLLTGVTHYFFTIQMSPLLGESNI
jgi:hypothetical protein